MGAKLGPGGRGGRRYSPSAEINVTPLVDVMLVLLVIFMITAPMMTVGVPVDLPKTQAKNLQSQDEPLIISIRANGDIYLQESKTTMEALVPRLTAIIGEKPDTRIFLRGDQRLNYGQIMQVMGTLNAAGFSKIALIAELPTPGSGAGKARAGKGG